MESRSRRGFVEERHCSIHDIYNITTRHQNTIKFLRDHSLLKTQVNCDQCGSKMSLIVNKSKADLEQFRCSRKECGKTKSIRTKSFFENGKLTLMESTRLVFYYFLQDFTLEEIYYQTGISKTHLANCTPN